MYGITTVAVAKPSIATMAKITNASAVFVFYASTSDEELVNCFVI